MAKPVTFCKFHHNDVPVGLYSEKSKAILCKLSVKFSGFTVVGGANGLQPNPANPEDSPLTKDSSLGQNGGRIRVSCHVIKGLRY